MNAQVAKEMRRKKSVIVIIFSLLSTSINSIDATSLASSSSSSLSASPSYLASPSRNKRRIVASSSPDKSITEFITERTCWWNEPCKKQFQRVFRCKCPDWAYCRGPGKYFAATCSASSTGYIWDQNVASELEPDADILLGKKRKEKNTRGRKEEKGMGRKEKGRKISASHRSGVVTSSKNDDSVSGKKKGRNGHQSGRRSTSGRPKGRSGGKSSVDRNFQTRGPSKNNNK